MAPGAGPGCSLGVVSGGGQARPAEIEPELSPGLHGRATADPGVTYRLLRLTWRLVAALLRIRLDVAGLENLPTGPDGRPAGRWIAAVMPHRTWIDPFVPWIALPVRPRLAFFGDARTMARSPIRRFVLARLGGVIPIPAGHDPATVEVHFEAARSALDAGMVFCLMPETGPASEPGRIRRLGSGLGYIALRNRVPIVPIVLGGNDELYLGRRVVLRVLAPLDPLELAGLDTAAGAPTAGAPAERAAVHHLLGALDELVAGPVAEAHAQANLGAGTTHRGRFLTHLFR